MGNICTCQTDESTANCPFGSVSVKHCGCLTKKDEDEQIQEINAAVEAQLKAIEINMRNQMLESLKNNGVIPPIMLSPNPVTRTLSVRFPDPSSPTPTEPVANSGEPPH